MKYASYVHPIKLKNIELKTNIFLAPMAGITDKTFRNICQSYGAINTVSEMISSKGLMYNDKKTKMLMQMDKNTFPKIVQLFGSEPSVMAKTVRILDADPNVDIIDLNVGCPATKVTKNGDGSEMLKNLSNLELVIKAMTVSTSKPITLKTRLGYYIDTPTIFDVIKICEKYGISMVAIHGRYKEDYFTNKARYDIIKQVKEKTNIPIIVNGDITSHDDAQKILDYTKCDGIMIGRAVLGKPWIFKELLYGKKYDVTLNTRFKVMLKHVRDMVEDKGEYVGVRELRKHIGWYVHSMKNATYVREKINMLTTKKEIVSLLNEYKKSLQNCKGRDE